MSKQLFGTALGGTLYRAIFQSNPVYVTFCLAGAFVGEQIYDGMVSSLWNSHNKGKRFEDIKFPPKDE